MMACQRIRLSPIAGPTPLHPEPSSSKSFERSVQRGPGLGGFPSPEQYQCRSYTTPQFKPDQPRLQPAITTVDHEPRSRGPRGQPHCRGSAPRPRGRGSRPRSGCYAVQERLLHYSHSTQFRLPFFSEFLMAYTYPQRAQWLALSLFQKYQNKNTTTPWTTDGQLQLCAASLGNLVCPDVTLRGSLTALCSIPGQCHSCVLGTKVCVYATRR